MLNSCQSLKDHCKRVQVVSENYFSKSPKKLHCNYATNKFFSESFYEFLKFQLNILSHYIQIPFPQRERQKLNLKKTYENLNFVFGNNDFSITFLFQKGTVNVR